jgi:hypothetical protein
MVMGGKIQANNIDFQILPNLGQPGGGRKAKDPKELIARN